MHKSREVRIGLVLYGGVSLAVYINGVAQEFFRAVRGDGIYRLLKALLGADIVVDVISGTSAGGLNGIYLAYALCQEPRPRNFLRFSELWRNHGDIDKLLRSPEDEPAIAARRRGLLPAEARSAFTDLGDWQSGAEEPSEVNELDLFITGTDFHGSVYTRFDSTGRPITVKDHRTLFQLKFRRGRYNDFAPSGPATSRRGTSWPAGETGAHHFLFSRGVSAGPRRKRRSSDQQLGSSLQKAALCLARPKTPRYYLDGGVLDNKPFSSTPDAIFHRTADGPVRASCSMWSRPRRSSIQRHRLRLSLVQAGVGALTAIPGYESIAGILRRSANATRRIEQFRNLAGACPRSQIASVSQPTPEQADLYRAAGSTCCWTVSWLACCGRAGRRFCWASRSSGSRRSVRGFLRNIRPRRPRTAILEMFDAICACGACSMSPMLSCGVSSPTADDVQAVDTCNRWIKCAEVIRFALESAVDHSPSGGTRNPRTGPSAPAPAEIWRRPAWPQLCAGRRRRGTILLGRPPDQPA